MEKHNLKDNHERCDKSFLTIVRTGGWSNNFQEAGGSLVNLDTADAPDCLDEASPLTDQDAFGYARGLVYWRYRYEGTKPFTLGKSVLPKPTHATRICRHIVTIIVIRIALRLRSLVCRDVHILGLRLGLNVMIRIRMIGIGMILMEMIVIQVIVIRIIAMEMIVIRMIGRMSILMHVIRWKRQG